MTSFRGLLGAQHETALRKLLPSAKKEMNRFLALLDIADAVTIKVKETHDKHWLAQYRSRSQFGRGPIFWISPEHPLDHDALITTLLHEYGHVIAEYIRLREPALHADREAVYPDEEDFAEGFAHFAYGQSQPWMEKFIARVVKAL